MSSNFAKGNMADTSKDGLLFGGGIHHGTATFTRGSKQVPAFVHNTV